MIRRPTSRLLPALVAGAALALVPAGGALAASPTLRMEIVHVVQGCHVWSTAKGQAGPATKVTLKRGTRLQIRVSCPMDFDFLQIAGPKLALGDPRTHTGTVRTIVFKKAGVYRLTAKNVQSSTEMGLQTLGADNTLRLTVVVH
jgi:hypothetical protein